MKNWIKLVVSPEILLFFFYLFVCLIASYFLLLNFLTIYRSRFVFLFLNQTAAKPRGKL